MLQSAGSPQPPPTEAMLTALLNEISAFRDTCALVLDDYHVLNGSAIDRALAFLLDHLPPQLHIVITTREDPQSPWRGYAPAANYAKCAPATCALRPPRLPDFSTTRWVCSSPPPISPRSSGARKAGSPGCSWLPSPCRATRMPSAFIEAFAGDHRYIVDYLVEEVLQHQSEDVRNFLLQTSILDRLCGPLCDAVTGQRGGRARLEDLERGNFLVVPLDDKRHWYRYHHLFADVLYAHLMAEAAEQPDQAPALHRRACEWYAQNGSMVDAIHHALAAGDFERAADLVELARPEMRRTRQEATLLGWFKALPEALFRRRPVLSAEYGGVLLATGEVDGVEARLRDAEQWLDPRHTPAETSGDPGAGSGPPLAPGNEMVVVDREAFRELPGSIAICRAGLALVRGDVEGTVKYARRALDLAPEGDPLGRGGAVAFLGLAAWASGDLETAHRTYADGMAGVQKAGFIADVINGAIARADIRIAQGRLREAMRTYEQALQLATQTAAEQGVPILRGAADLYVGMSEIYRERNDLHAAMQNLLRSEELGAQSGFPQNRSRWCVAMARVREVQGDLDAALDLLNEAARLYVRDFFPNARPVAALQARVWIAQGLLDEAANWAREQGLAAADDLSYLREFEHVTLARLLLAQHKRDSRDDQARASPSLREAMGLLLRLRHAAEAGGRAGSIIEILVLQALAYRMDGDIPTALTALQRALTLAEPEGYVRVFVDEGPSMAALLQEAAKQGISARYVGRIRAALTSPEDSKTAVSKPVTPGMRDPLEPLSERELEVLRLLRSDLSGPEIASALMVSLNTLHTHTRNIYAKLGVNTRRAAVRTAEERRLL